MPRALARCREAGILQLLPEVLTRMTMLDLRAGQLEDAIGHLHEELQIISRTGGWFHLVNALYSCGYVCAAAGRRAEAVTAWSAHFTLTRREGFGAETAWWDAHAGSAARDPAGSTRIRPARPRPTARR
jgi:hypothetical protein